MEIKRDYYLQKLIDRKSNGQIKAGEGEKMQRKIVKYCLSIIMIVALLIGSAAAKSTSETTVEFDEVFTSPESAVFGKYTIDMWMAKDDARTTLAMMFDMIIRMHYLNEDQNESEIEAFDRVSVDAFASDGVSVGRIGNNLFYMVNGGNTGCCYIQYDAEKDEFNYIRTEEGAPVTLIDQEEKIDQDKFLDKYKEYLEINN